VKIIEKVFFLFSSRQDLSSQCCIFSSADVRMDDASCVLLAGVKITASSAFF